MKQDASFDLVIVGGGVAGMVAAVRGGELGLRVAVLEKGSSPDYICNSRYSGGIFHVAYEDPKAPREEIEAAITRIPYEDADPALAAVLAERAHELIDWMRDMGVRFIRGGNRAAKGWMLAPPRPLIGGLNHEGRGPDLLLRRLAKRLGEQGGELKLGHRATGLVMDGGRCCGVEAETANGTVRIAAGAVLLSDGGFQANLDMLRQGISPAPEAVRQRGAATGTGDALTMAARAGAAHTPLKGFYGHLLSRDAFDHDLLWPYPQLDEIAGAGIVVDGQGRRFIDEGSGGIFMANRIAARPNPLDCSVICDSAIWEGPGSRARIPPNPHLERGGATLYRANSIEELARMAGFEPDALRHSIESYNTALHNGTLAALSPARSDVWYQPMPIEVAPFYAIPTCAGITYTMGGIRIDPRARVLDGAGAPISGLYAAGSSVGGFEGGEKVRYVGGLTRAGLFGMIAAQEVAGARAKNRSGSSAAQSA